MVSKFQNHDWTFSFQTKVPGMNHTLTIAMNGVTALAISFLTVGVISRRPTPPDPICLPTIRITMASLSPSFPRAFIWLMQLSWRRTETSTHSGLPSLQDVLPPSWSETIAFHPSNNLSWNCKIDGKYTQHTGELTRNTNKQTIKQQSSGAESTVSLESSITECSRFQLLIGQQGPMSSRKLAAHWAGEKP